MTTNTDVRYHRLARISPRYRWWRPLLEILLFLILAVVFTVALGLGGTAIAVALGAEESVILSETPDYNDPATMALMLLMVVAWLPAALLAARLSGRRAGFLYSVLGRLRWRLLGQAALVTALILVPVQTLSLLLGGFWEEGVSSPSFAPSNWLLMTVVLLLVPFQATAEELVFRGLLPQVVGAWVPSVILAFGVQVPLFVIGHDYNLVGLIDICVFALLTSWLTYRSGGLEFAIGLHVVNNIVALLPGAFGVTDLNATEAHPIALVFSTLPTVVICVLLMIWWERTADARNAENSSPQTPGSQSRRLADAPA